MTKGFGEYYLSCNLRNGVGVDLEFSTSRAVWITDAQSEEIDAASFEGAIVLLPFLVITFGKIWSED